MAGKDRKDDLEDMLIEPSFSDMDKGKEDADTGSSGKKNRAGVIAGFFKSRRMWVILIACSILFIVIIAGIFILFPGKEKSTTDQVLTESVGATGEEDSSGFKDQIIFEDIVELEPFERLHLKTSSTMGLITMGLALELTDGQYRKQIHLQEDRIRQIVITQAGEMTWLELRNPDGKIRLKYELLKRINSLYPQVTVRNIYYTYFIMQ